MEGLLKKAAESRNKLEVIYLSNDNRISQRVIKVLGVNGHSVKAYCYSKRQFRLFKLTNILSIGPIRKRMGA